MSLFRRKASAVYAALILVAICICGNPSSAVRAELGGSAPDPRGAADPAAPSYSVSQDAPPPLPYPYARRSDQVDDYHGKKVADPYRWLEQSDSPETTAWVDAENKLTSGYMNQIPARPAIKARLTKLWNYDRYGAPFTQHDVYFYIGSDAQHNQDVLYVMYSQGSEPHIMLDPEKMYPDGKRSLTGAVPTHDGKLIAYGLSTAGTDWQEWKIRQTRSWNDVSDDLKAVASSSINWTRDDKGFFYSAFSAAGGDQPSNKYVQRLYYHRLDSAQVRDDLIYDPPDGKNWKLEPHLADDGRYMVIYIREGAETNNRVYLKDLNVNQGDVVPLIGVADASYQFISNDGPIFWFLTNQDAPRGRVIAVDIRDPLRAHWKTVLPQSEDPLESVTAISDVFIACYTHEGHSRVERFDMDGKSKGDVALPGIGIAAGFRGSRLDQETFYAFTSFTAPTTLYHFDPSDGTSTVLRQPGVDFEPAEYETRQVFYSSNDGTKVPMFISYKKELKLDGNNPTLLYGNGGFGVSLNPSFSASALAWMELGGVYVVANIRGGGEYGEEWHKAGMKRNKQKVFDDFIAGAEWLIANKYTSSAKLAIDGVGNGGLLVGACMTQRPDLFAAAISETGLLDMLRFQKFPHGANWVSEYGSSDDPDDFKALSLYSPLQNIKPGAKYPATLIMVTQRDGRVATGHSFKFAAALQAAQASGPPVLIRIQQAASAPAAKGLSSATQNLIEERADYIAFLMRALQMTLPAAADEASRHNSAM
jgi:prolyl oligopeptidase